MLMRPVDKGGHTEVRLRHYRSVNKRGVNHYEAVPYNILSDVT